ncbi:MAG: flagellar biosynthesis anti-sigma factor FlgM [Steroidobacteraceae bacterium]
MSNKISGLNPPALQEAVPLATPGNGTRSPASSPSSSARDSESPGVAPAGSSSGTGDVHITDSASQLASLEQTLRSLPAVDGARVAQLQTAIEQGTYTVQPQHVADQLIQLEQSLAELPAG